MEMTGYTKLFGSIVASTIWREPHTVRIVWITMLAMANKFGIVEASMPGLADLARVTLDECREALEHLQSADEYSRTPDHQGRRVEPADGGWLILNHAKYRAKMGVDERREYLRVKQKEARDRKKLQSTNVNKSLETSTGSTHTEADAQSKADSKELPPTVPGEAKSRKATNLPTTPQSQRIATLFNRRTSTGWSDAEIRSYKKIGEIEEADFMMLEAYYASERAKGEEGRHRRDLGTFLNHYTGEIDRARAWQAQQKPVNGSPSRQDEPGWAEWLKRIGKAYTPQFGKYTHDLLRDQFRKQQNQNT